MARLLVSVRSAAEALAAAAGGASIVDVKEPDRGPLGRADPEVWRAVRAAVPVSIPVSVSLGELTEWRGLERRIGPSDFVGIAFRKVGLAGCRRDPGWERAWAHLREVLGPGPGWIAVVYADWIDADAPEPDRVLEAAGRAGCAGILVDTWEKRRLAMLDPAWADWISRVRRSGLMIALAGGLDVGTIKRLTLLDPDLFAVRGAACSGNDRRAAIDPDRVAALVAAAAGVNRPGA